jgi:pyridoxamine 5'-phosphate oxidase
MMLATASADGVPAARIVLLKGLDERGFVFYSNYESPKGRDLAQNPRAALTFYWPQLERQGASQARPTESVVKNPGPTSTAGYWESDWSKSLAAKRGH